MNAGELIKAVNDCGELNWADKKAVIKLIRERTWATLDSSDQNQESISDRHNSLPKGIAYENLSPVAQKSYDAWKKLDPDNQENVSYVQEDDEWEVRIGDFQMPLTNATAPADPDNGIFVHHVLREDRTYFNQAAAFEHADSQWMTLPTNDQWEQMADLLGWYNQLRDVLQILFIGIYTSDRDVDNRDVGHSAWLWSDGSGDDLFFSRTLGDVGSENDVLDGRAVRLLRNALSDV